MTRIKGEGCPIDNAESGDTVVLEDSEEWHIWGVLGKNFPAATPPKGCARDDIVKDGKKFGPGTYMGWSWDCEKCRGGAGDGGAINLRVEKKTS